MPNPVFITDENVKFDSTLTPSLVLSDNAGIKKLVLWDKIPLDIQATFETTMDQYGPGLPIVPSASKSIMNFGGLAVLGDPTGVAGSSTSGYQTLNYGGTVVMGDPTGLSNLAATSGEQTVDFDVAESGGNATGLSNAATVAAFVAIADVTFTYVSTGTAGNAARIRYVDPAAINQTLSVSVVSNDVTVSLATDGGGVITSTATDVALAVTVSMPAQAVMSALVTGVGGNIVTAVGFTNLAGGDTEVLYAFDVVIDAGGTQNISFAGNTAQTITTLIGAISGQLTGAVAALTGGDIVFTSNSTGVASTVALTDVTLFTSLAVNAIVAAVPGVDGVSYNVGVNVDGISVNFSIFGAAAQTFGQLVSVVDAAVGAGAVVAIMAGNIKITSTTTGATSQASFTNFSIFQATTGFVSALAPVLGTGDEAFRTLVNVDGVNQSLSINGADMVLFSNLITALNTELSGAVASIVNGDIEIISATTGISSEVRVTEISLFRNVVGYLNTIAFYPGIDDIEDVLRFNSHTNGTSYIELFSSNTITVGLKPTSVSGTTDPSPIYWNGTAWVHFYDDSPV